MPRKRRTTKKKMEVTPSKTISDYFPPSPLSAAGEVTEELHVVVDVKVEKPESVEEPRQQSPVETQRRALIQDHCYINKSSKGRKATVIKELTVKTRTVNGYLTPESSPEKSQPIRRLEPKSQPIRKLNTKPQPIRKLDTKPQPIKKLEPKTRLADNQIKHETNPKNSLTKPDAKVTDYFEVRKSSRRKTAKQMKREQLALTEYKIITGCEDGLEVCIYEGKGRGVAASQPFSKGDFIVEYIGELMEVKEARSREEQYKNDQSKGCYMYFFAHQGKRYCIDATEETDKLGRLLNHSRSNPNCMTKTVDLEGNPHLILVAVRDIEIGEELLYDYGDRSKEALESNPWLKD